MERGCVLLKRKKQECGIFFELFREFILNQDFFSVSEMVDGWAAGPKPGRDSAAPGGFAELAAASFNAGGPGASQTSDLPPGWERKVTPEGQPYFVNHNDCTTHWEAPAASLYPAPHPAPSLQSQAPLQPAASFGGPPAPAGWSGASGAPSVDGWGDAAAAPTPASPPRMQRTASIQLQVNIEEDSVQV